MKTESKSHFQLKRPRNQARLGVAMLGIIALLIGYLVASRAIDTGSLQQYFLTLLLAIFAVNRLFRAIWPARRGALS